MSITLESPADIENRLREAEPDLDNEVRQAVALDLFRKEKITHYELSLLLGLDRLATERFLKLHDEYAQTLTLEEIESDRQTLRKLLDELER